MSRAWWVAAVALGACATEPTYVVEGVVVEVHPGEIVIDHAPIAGFVGGMTSPFEVTDRDLAAGVRPGHRVIGRIRVDGTRTTLEKLRVVGDGPAPAPAGPPPLEVGDVLEARRVVLDDGTSGVVGAGQGAVTGLTFLYTTCPEAERCPATTARLQALAAEVPEVRWVAVTLDPERDTPAALALWAAEVGARPGSWRVARLEPEATVALARRVGVPVARGANGALVHEIRWVVLDADGVVRARFASNTWTTDDLRSALAAVPR